MEYLEFVSVPVIVTIVYQTVNLIKHASKNSEKFNRFLPLLSGGLGAVLGVAFYYLMPNTIAASNVLVAIFSGAASGLSATGCNQIIKQFSKKPDDKSNNTDESSDSADKNEKE